MERFEEKIIDLVDVVTGPESSHRIEKNSTIGLSEKTQHDVKLEHIDNESLFQKEVGIASSLG
ncbi:MAG: hypothetical protein C0407_04465, partial [Desulfobacca sp.]|nr:hypothetical protein [Desulfobacca sp.]